MNPLGSFVRKAWLSLTSRRLGLLWAEGSKAGQSVTPSTALTVSAFWAGVRVWSQTVGTLPLGFYERRSDGERIERNDLDIAYILQESPNSEQTASEFWGAVPACLCLRGVFYARKRFNGAGRLSSIEPMFPDSVSPRREGGRNFFDYVDADGYRHELRDEEVFRVQGWGVGQGGLSPLQYQANVLGIALAGDEQAGGVLKSGLSSSGFLQIEAELDEAQRKQWQKQMADFQGSSNAGKIMVLEGGTKYQPLSIRPDEAQLLMSRSFSVEEACRALGIPPILVGHSAQGQTMWGTGVEQIILGWLMLELRPRLVNIEQAIKKHLLTPAERVRFYPEFAVEGLLRADSAGRAALYSSFTQNGVMTRNEVRRLENLPKVPKDQNGDELTVQANLVRLADLGQTPAASVSARAALLSWLGTGSDDAA